MATLTDYKGLDVVENATGDGGIALTDNFKELADRAPYQGSGNPGVNDDTTKGFSPGDTWLNTSTQVLWSCISNSTGAAVWKSVLKRTSTALELIPQESSESVQVNGNCRTTGWLGVGRAAAAAPLEVQQVTSLQGLKVLSQTNPDGRYVKLSIDGSGNTYLQASLELNLESQTSGVINVLGTRFSIRGGRYITFDNVAGTAPGFSMGTETSGGKLIIATGNGLSTVQVAVDPSNGNVGLGTNAPTAKVDVNSDKVRVRTAKTPTSASDTGNQGDICWDANYVYVCVATNTWKRAALATW